MRAVVTELVGTWLFITSIGLAIANAGEFAPLVIGFALAVLVFMGGNISGAHYNPAVTLGLFVNGQVGFITWIAYTVAQVVGAFAGAATSALILSNINPADAANAITHSFAVAPNPDASLLAVLLVEAIFTFTLMLVIFNVAVSAKATPNSYYGLAIGLTIVVAAYVGGSISGGAFNPAVATGSIVYDALFADGIGGGNIKDNLLMYWAAPCAGAIIAALFFAWQDGGEADEA